MSDAPYEHAAGEGSATRPKRASPIVQATAIVLTGAVGLTASAALAWLLKGQRRGPEPPGPTPSPVASVAAAAAAGPEDVLLRRGRLTYQVHCARCHGAEGHGDGSDAERLQPPPRDFAAPNWRFAPAAESVRQVIVAGIPGTAMPGWGTSLSRLELDGLVAHILALAPPDTGRVEEAAGQDQDPARPLSPALASLLTRAGFVAEVTPRAAPELTVRDLDGNAANLAGRRGRLLLLLFWGTSCAHCLAELPAAVRFSDRQRGRGLDIEVVPICVDETDPAIIRAVAGPQLERQRLYVDPSAAARLLYDVQTLPTFVMIDCAGRLVARAAGARDWTDPVLDALVRRASDPPE
jgi:mono/diheme cytochrome c family protein